MATHTVISVGITVFSAFLWYPLPHVSFNTVNVITCVYRVQKNRLYLFVAMNLVPEMR
jgi:hypothetical protein